MVVRAVRSGIVQNRLLAAMKPEEFDLLRPHLDIVPLKAREVLQDSSRTTEFAYFIESGIVSRVVRSQGGSVETAIVGRLGFVGISIAIGTTISAGRSVVQTPGYALRIPAKELSEIIREQPQIRELLLRYVQSLMRQKAQSVLCGVRHDLEQRLARWLLLAFDRLEDNSLPITHDILAELLGVRRAGVTVALAAFEDEGLIRRTRGNLYIEDRAGLERRSCECYRAITGGYSWLLLSQSYEHELPELINGSGETSSSRANVAARR